MSFGDSYLKHLEVLGNVGMTGIEPVNYNGVEIVPIQFLKQLLPDPHAGVPPKENLYWLRGQRDSGGQERCVYVYNVKTIRTVTAKWSHKPSLHHWGTGRSPR